QFGIRATAVADDLVRRLLLDLTNDRLRQIIFQAAAERDVLEDWHVDGADALVIIGLGRVAEHAEVPSRLAAAQGEGDDERRANISSHPVPPYRSSPRGAAVNSQGRSAA